LTRTVSGVPVRSERRANLVARGEGRLAGVRVQTTGSEQSQYEKHANAVGADAQNPCTGDRETQKPKDGPHHLLFTMLPIKSPILPMTASKSLSVVSSLQLTNDLLLTFTLNPLVLPIDLVVELALPLTVTSEVGLRKLLSSLPAAESAA